MLFFSIVLWDMNVCVCECAVSAGFIQAFAFYLPKYK